MGWLPASVFVELRAAALRLTREERKALTWDEAHHRFVASDTLEMAKWVGLRNKFEFRDKDDPDGYCTAWNAVCILRSIGQAEGDPWGDH